MWYCSASLAGWLCVCDSWTHSGLLLFLVFASKRKLGPLLVHPTTLDLQQQREEVLIIHGTWSSAPLLLQPTLSLAGQVKKKKKSIITAHLWKVAELREKNYK